MLGSFAETLADVDKGLFFHLAKVSVSNICHLFSVAEAFYMLLSSFQVGFYFNLLLSDLI